MPALRIWYEPLLTGPLIAGAIVTGMLPAVVFTTDAPLFPLTMGWALMGVLLTTVAVRRRMLGYGYAAGAIFVGTVLSQFYDWGFRDAQWFVLPASLYLLLLAELLRHFQGSRQVSRVIETAALLLMCSTTLVQSLIQSDRVAMGYAVALCGESLLLLGYGVLRKLRVPFVGGMIFFVVGVIWLSIDPLMAANKWVVLGLLGLLMVGIYVLLEEKQEQLVQASRAWMEQLKEWR